MARIKRQRADMVGTQCVKSQDHTQATALPNSSALEWLTQFYSTTPPLPESFMADRSDGPPQVREFKA